MWEYYFLSSEKTFPSNEMRKVRQIRTVILQVRSWTTTLKPNTKVYDFPVETARAYTCTYTAKIIISGGCSLDMQCVHSSCFEHELCHKALVHHIFGFSKGQRKVIQLSIKEICLRDSENEKYLSNLLSWLFWILSQWLKKNCGIISSCHFDSNLQMTSVYSAIVEASYSCICFAEFAKLRLVYLHKSSGFNQVPKCRWLWTFTRIWVKIIVQ